MVNTPRGQHLAQPEEGDPYPGFHGKVGFSQGQESQPSLICPLFDPAWGGLPSLCQDLQGYSSAHQHGSLFLLFSSSSCPTCQRPHYVFYCTCSHAFFILISLLAYFFPPV